MADFNTYFPTLMVHEGGFSDNPHDRGGATKYGLTLRTWLDSGYDKDGDGDIDVADLKLITQDDAKLIAKKLYWDKVKGDDIPSQSVAEFLFDWGYNSGAGTAVKHLQAALGVNSDGVIGPVTLNKLKSFNQKILFLKLREARLAFVARIAANDPSQSRFLNGWKNRINSFSFKA